MIDEVRTYLALLRAPPSTSTEALRALAHILDRLALAYHETTSVPVGSAADAPQSVPYEELRAKAARAFPAFGFYAVIRSEADAQAQSTLADAIDDLADLARELIEVEWRWINNGPDDAMWRFRFGYRSHWGRHLHDLRGYVHTYLFEGESPIEPLLEPGPYPRT